MLRQIHKIILATTIIFLSGCATTYKIGKEFNIENIASIKNGITTNQEIISFFGQPLRKGILNGNDVFVYQREDVIIESNNAVKKVGNTLVIEFNRNGIVKNYYLNVPGKESVLFGFLIQHKREMEQLEAEQNPISM